MNMNDMPSIGIMQEIYDFTFTNKKSSNLVQQYGMILIYYHSIIYAKIKFSSNF